MIYPTEAPSVGPEAGIGTGIAPALSDGTDDPTACEDDLFGIPMRSPDALPALTNFIRSTFYE